MVKKRRKVVDKWKLKKWYSVLAPEAFERKELAQIISSNPSNLINRVVNIPLSDLTGKMNRYALYTNVRLRVVDVKGEKAYSEMIGHYMSFAYLKSLARRRRSVIHEVVDVTTKDGRQVRLKLLLVTKAKVSAVVKKNLRKALVEQVIKSASSRNYYDLLKAIFDRRVANEIFKATNIINPVESIEVKKSELKEVFNNAKS